MKRTLFLPLMAVAACAGSAPVSVSARVGTSGAPLHAPSGGLLVADGISLDRVRVVLSNLRVERGSGGDEVEISRGPLLLDVAGAALGSAVEQLVAANLPTGSYDGLKVSVRPVLTEPDGAAPGFADLVARRASVLLEGTVDGQPFTFTSGLEADLEDEAPLAVAGASANFTVNLDPTAWFEDASGSRLDPTDPARRAAIEDNLRASFSAFQDDDLGGADDHGASR